MSTKKIIFIFILTLTGFAGAYFISSNTNLLGSFFYNDWRTMGHGFYRGHMMMGGMMHFIFWLILLFVIISAMGNRKPSFAHTNDSAIEILRKKYVNGDISKAEFTDKMKYLID
jgi:uncharacterized membrane protein